MKPFKAWGWSIAVLVRSLLAVIICAVFLGLWGLGAYEWLGIPESSALVLLLSLLWAITQAFATVAAVAGTASAAVETVADDALQISLASLFRFGRKRFVRCLSWSIVASVAGLALAEIFDWVNRHSMEIASFLTFRSGKPVSYLDINKGLVAVEFLVWVAVVSLFMSFLVALFRTNWRLASGQLGRILGYSVWSFLTGLIAVVFCGGVAYALANWRSGVPAGFWDYSQVVARTTLALIILAAGWFFWLLSLAQLDSQSPENSPS